MTESMGDSIPLKGYNCDELNMFGKLMGGRRPRISNNVMSWNKG